MGFGTIEIYLVTYFTSSNPGLGLLLACQIFFFLWVDWGGKEGKLFDLIVVLHSFKDSISPNNLRMKPYLHLKYFFPCFEFVYNSAYPQGIPSVWKKVMKNNFSKNFSFKL